MNLSVQKNKTILITGGCGYIGSRIAILLDKIGYKVRVVDKATPEERGIVFKKSIDFEHGDLKNPEITRQALKNIDLVVHLAANIGALEYMHKYQAEIIQENLAIDATLYPLMIEQGVKKIVYSSSSMVFQNCMKYPYKEDYLFKKTLLPINIYGLSKLAGEYFCKAYHNQFGLDYVILRYHNVYGPGEFSKGENPGDVHVIPALIEKILRGQYPLELLGDPKATRPFSYVDDSVEATIMLTEEFLKGNEGVINNDFNIGPAKAINVVDLAKMIWGLIGDGREFKYVVKETKAITAQRRELDPSKIKKAIGWKTETSLKNGLLATIDWIKNRSKIKFSVLYDTKK